MRDRRSAYKVLVGIPVGKRPLEDLGVDERIILKMDLQDVRWEGMDWIDLAEDKYSWRALVNAAVKFRVP
jgi:hypothetical protein